MAGEIPPWTRPRIPAHFFSLSLASCVRFLPFPSIHFQFTTEKYPSVDKNVSLYMFKRLNWFGARAKPKCVSAKTSSLRISRIFAFFISTLLVADGPRLYPLFSTSTFTYSDLFPVYISKASHKNLLGCFTISIVWATVYFCHIHLRDSLMKSSLLIAHLLLPQDTGLKTRSGKFATLRIA